MVLVENLNICLTDQNGTPLKETRLGNGKVYFHAPAGGKFQVRVTGEGNDIIDRYPETVRGLLVSLSLDGEDIGYFKSANTNGQPVNFDFVGFIKSGKIYAFKFAETFLPEEYEDALRNLVDEEKGGTFTLQFYPGYPDHTSHTTFTGGNTGLPSSEKAIDKNKKFWKQPSLTTAADETGKPYASRQKSFQWRRSSDVPFLTWTGYYHTPMMIDCLLRIEKDQRRLEQGFQGDDIEDDMGHGNKRSSSSSDRAQGDAKKQKKAEVIDLTGDDIAI